MKTVGIFEAKNKLSELVAEVERGESIMLTRNGRPVAELVPIAADGDEARAAMRWLLGRRWTLHGASTKELVNAGRRH
mgnify:CR=1 FL=1